MQIEPAMCPACSTAFDPLRSRAIIVIDGRVRAFCSPACRDRGMKPPERALPINDANAVTAPRSSGWRHWPREQLVLAGAAVISLGVFIALIAVGRQRTAARAAGATSATVGSRSARPADVMNAFAQPASGPQLDNDWVQPLAGVARHSAARDRRLFSGAREGIPASECGAGRCAVDIEAAPGDIVMSVHDGVVEAVERDPDPTGRRGQEGRFVRINHKGGTVTSSYLQLDGIREDLKPGIPVRVGEAIGTVASRARLRFAISLHDPPDAPVLFIDPQPLLVLWPTRKRASMSLHAMERAPQAAAN